MKHSRLLLALLVVAASVFTLLPTNAAPQLAAAPRNAELLKDIDTSNFAGSDGSGAREFVTIGDTVYFTAANASNGNEVWKKVGAAPAELVIDARPGPIGVVQELTVYNNALYFISTGRNVNTSVIYRSDGTANGTQIIYTGPSGIFGLFGSPNGLYFFTREVLSSFPNPPDIDVTLWKSQGVANDAVALKVVDVSTDPQRSFYWYGTTGNTSFFLAPFSSAPQLFQTDGTTAGTRAVFTDNTLVAKPADGFPVVHAVVDNQFYFLGFGNNIPAKVYRTDGTTPNVFYERDQKLFSRFKPV